MEHTAAYYKRAYNFVIDIIASYNSGEIESESDYLDLFEQFYDRTA